MRYFRLTAAGRKLFGWEREVDGRRAHWMKVPLSWFTDPLVLGLNVSERYLLLGLAMLCMRRTNLVPTSPKLLRLSLNLSRNPDLSPFMALGLIELDDTERSSDPMRGEEREEIEREEIDSATVVATPPEPPAETPKPEPPTPPGGKAVAIVEPLPWNREAAEIWTQEYRGAPPKQFFAALKPLVKAHGWERVRPALVTYLAETPVEYVNLVKAFVGAFGTWTAKANGAPPRGSPRGSVGERTLSAAERFIRRGGEIDQPERVLVGPEQTGDGGTAGDR